MQVEIFSLCDAATGERGKLSILGAFDTLWVAETPAVYPHQCTIVLRVRFTRMEKGEHKVLVNFVDSDGKKVIQPMADVLKINFPDEQSSSSANLILNIQGLELKELGEHSIDLSIDGQQKASLPLFVKMKK